jgi:hypothetical protein
VQVPTLPARLQASQAPPQVALQQTASAQMSLWHSLFARQPWPFGFLLLQTPPTQKLPATQPLSLAQVVAQAVPLQT